MHNPEDAELELLRRLIGVSNLRLYSLNMSVEWWMSALVPDMSVSVELSSG